VWPISTALWSRSPGALCASDSVTDTLRGSGAVNCTACTAGQYSRALPNKVLRALPNKVLRALQRSHVSQNMECRVARDRYVLPYRNAKRTVRTDRAARAPSPLGSQTAIQEPLTLTQNPQPAAPNPIGIGGWMAGVSFQRSYVRQSRSRKNRLYR
jgi:hypothetical protein